MPSFARGCVTSSRCRRGSRSSARPPTGSTRSRPLESLRPDIVLMDLAMPRRDGVEAMRELRAGVPEARVIILTSFLEDDRLLPALQAGAAGYLLKNVEPEELARAIRTAARGGTLIDPAVAARLVETLSERVEQRPPLTAREQEVLRLIARGYPNKRIARRARDCRKDGEDACLARPRQARGRRPHAGCAVRDATRPLVLRPMSNGGGDRADLPWSHDNGNRHRSIARSGSCACGSASRPRLPRRRRCA